MSGTAGAVHSAATGRSGSPLRAKATPPPVIVMGHGLGSVRTMRLDAYAERFAAAGYACLLFDYRHFGDSDGQPRQLLDITKQRGELKKKLSEAESLWVEALEAYEEAQREVA